MRIAIPVVDGQLARHFGHCEEFMLFDVDPDAGSVGSSASLQAPPHEPGLLPRWLKDEGVDVVITGGMGRRAQGLFAESGVKIVVGAASDDPRTIVEQYLSGALATGDNLCDH
jgi:ATP-binding protein involved in chromosome partitioning